MNKMITFLLSFPSFFFHIQTEPKKTWIQRQKQNCFLDMENQSLMSLMYWSVKKPLYPKIEHHNKTKIIQKLEIQDLDTFFKTRNYKNPTKMYLSPYIKLKISSRKEIRSWKYAFTSQLTILMYHIIILASKSCTFKLNHLSIHLVKFPFVEAAIMRTHKLNQVRMTINQLYMWKPNIKSKIYKLKKRNWTVVWS